MTTTSTSDLTVMMAERLGLTMPISNDLAGLRLAYRAWCERVPFDNLRKLIVHQTQATGPLPGDTSEDFFRAFLTHGTGGTCWSSSNALTVFLQGVGFDARRATGSVMDMFGDNHGTTIVYLDGARWLVDTALLSLEPLPLETGRDFRYQEGGVDVEVDPEGEGFFVWGYFPPLETPLMIRLLEEDVPRELFRSNHERSRSFGPFNDRICAIRNIGGTLTALRGNLLARRSGDGQTVQPLDREGLMQALMDLGYSREIVEELDQCGAIDASLAPSDGPPPMPELGRVPPSVRGA